MNQRAAPYAAVAATSQEVDFAGHGIGKLLVPLIARRRAASEMPGNVGRLKQQLEAGI